MKIRDILRHKGRDVVTASQGDSVLSAVRVLVDHNIGGVVVVDGEEVIGILTERDILRLVAKQDTGGIVNVSVEPGQGHTTQAGPGPLR